MLGVIVGEDSLLLCGFVTHAYIGFNLGTYCLAFIFETYLQKSCDLLRIGV